MSPGDGSNNRGGEEAVTRRSTRNSGKELEINLWGLKDLPKTNTARKTPVRNRYTVKVEKKARNKDVRELRRSAKKYNLAVSSLPVYIVTGAPRAPREQAAGDLPTRGEKREDATAASAGCGASVRSTILSGSMPVINIYPSNLTEPEADNYLTSLGGDNWCSACPERLSYVQCTGDRSAPAERATARTREVTVAAAAAVEAARRLPQFSGGKAAAPRTIPDGGNKGSDGGIGGDGGGRSDGREGRPVHVDTGRRARAMSTVAAGGWETFRSDSKEDECLVGGGVNSVAEWYSQPYYRVSHQTLASSRKRRLDTDDNDSDLGGLAPVAGRRGGIVLHGQGGGGRRVEADERYSAEGTAESSCTTKRMKVDFGVGGAQGSGRSIGSGAGCDGIRSDDSGGGGGGIPIVSSGSMSGSNSIIGGISDGGGGSGRTRGGGNSSTSGGSSSSISDRMSGSTSAGAGNVYAKPSSRDTSFGRKRTRRDDDDGDGVNDGDRDVDINTALGYDGDHEGCVVSTRAAGGKEEALRRTRGSGGQIKRSRSSATVSREV